MRNAAFIIAAAALTTAGFAQNNLDLSITTAPTYDAATGVETGGRSSAQIELAEAPAADMTFRFMISATQTGSAGLNGISTFDGNIDFGGTGTVAPSLLTNTEAIGFPVPGNDFQARAGMLPQFRGTIGPNNGDPGNGSPAGDGSINFLPLSIVNGGDGDGEGQSVDVYVFDYTLPAGTEGKVDIVVSANFAGLWDNGVLDQPVNVNSSSFSINVLPAPGATALLGLGGLVAARRRR